MNSLKIWQKFKYLRKIWKKCNSWRTYVEIKFWKWLLPISSKSLLPSFFLCGNVKINVYKTIILASFVWVWNQGRADIKSGGECLDLRERERERATGGCSQQ
jgi:hypothetical protein